MSDIDKFRCLLQYFVAHLEFCEANLLKGWDGETSPLVTNTRGYNEYLKKYDVNWKDFKRTGNDKGKTQIQKQIASWANLSKGKVTIGINTTGPKKYMSDTNFLNWETTWMAIRANWDTSSNTINELVITEGEPVKKMFKLRKQLSIKDNLYDASGNVVTSNKDELIGFWNEFFSLLIPAKLIPSKLKYNSVTHPLNLILYGPPGTGKTYNTIFHALAILENKTIDELIGEKCSGKTSKDKLSREEYKILKKDFDHQVKDGQIVFTTFHQSMCYEDFIEGIKPEPVTEKITAIHKNEVGSATTITQFGDGTTTIDNLSRMKYEVKDGIFKKMCDIKAFLKDAMARKTVFLLEGGGGFIVDKIDEKSICCSDLEGKVVAKEDLDDLTTYLKKELESKPEAEPETDQEEEREEKDEKEKKTNPEWNPNRNPNVDPNPDPIPIPPRQEHPYCSAIIRKFLERKVLIIDEINRGNVSQIFGELITLIEKEKRLGNDEWLTATLPYSQEAFGVPNNVYIIGTMNTADRSVEALDTALRRRFSFEEMMPDTSKATGGVDITYTDKSGTPKTENIPFSSLLKTINERIVLLKDREHQIGHSYFMNCPATSDDEKKKKWLKKVFKDNIIPLLQEYFYGDYKKIYYVLGGGKVDELKPNPAAGFVLIQVMPIDIKACFAGDVDDYEVDIAEARYEINTINDDFDIDAAIAKLMKRI